MKRAAILIVAILIGAAAPARAWCEATCIAPADASEPAHCPSHEPPQQDGPSLSASPAAACPVIETARPVTAKLEVAVPPSLAPARAIPHAPPPVTTAPLHLRALGLFDTDIPLRV